MLEARVTPSREDSSVKLLFIVESTANGFSAYSPDVPGCIATGTTRDEVETNMREAIELHFDGLRADGAPLPSPTCYALSVEVTV